MKKRYRVKFQRLETGKPAWMVFFQKDPKDRFSLSRHPVGIYHSLDAALDRTVGKIQKRNSRAFELRGVH